MTAPISGELSGGPPSGSPGLTAVIDSVAKLNALLNSDGPGANDSAGPGDIDDSAGSSVVQRMAMRIGELGLLFSVNAGREVVAPPSVSRIPNTAPWLRGLANVRGSLVPVVDAAVALGVTRTSGTPSYLLIFGQGESAIGLVIDGLPRLLDIEINGSPADLPPVPSSLTPYVSAAYEHAGRIWYDVDLDGWFGVLADQVAAVGAAA